MSTPSFPITNEHPRKIAVDDIAPDTQLRDEDGWVGFDVRFLVTAERLGSSNLVFGTAEMPPGAKHDIHRHAHAEEVAYLVKGEGVSRVGDEDVRMVAGELVFIKKGELHGFRNTSPTDTAVLVWCYAGASSLADAGYEHFPELGS